MNERRFGCVAEAVAHYYNNGFTTIYETDNEIPERVMQAGDKFVCIRHIGFCDVVAIEDR